MKIYLFSKIGIYDMVIAPFLGKQVAVGLFKGMIYENVSIGSVRLPKLYGTYEMEVQKFISTMDLSRFDVFVDVGCADGYYLAGIGKISSIPKIIGYDPNKYASAQCKRIIRDNKLSPDRFEVHGFFREEDFHQIVESYRKPLFLIDVDGYEMELFKNIPAAYFRHCTFLIETHDFIVPGIKNNLIDYFGSSHVLECKDSANGTDNTPYLDHFSDYVKKKIVSEYRPGTQSYLKVIPRIQEDALFGTLN